MKLLFTKIIATITAAIMTLLSMLGSDLIYKYRVEAPAVSSDYTETEAPLADNADFYISPSGSDNGNGSFGEPFASFERAMEAVRNCSKKDRNGITVAIMAGEYRVSSVNFTSDDSGTEGCPVTYTTYGDGDVILNGGITLDPAKFSKVTDKEILSRLGRKAGRKVLCFNLADSGITSDDYGKIYAIGTYNTAYLYTGDTVGPLYCELFVNDTRSTLARYPDNGFLNTGKVVKEGTYDGKAENPESEIYKIDSALANRINGWKTLEDVWMFGFWRYDWADASSPVGSFDYKEKTISPKYASMYGSKKDAPYYFFNILEELDSEGEWYLDRQNGTIYLYPCKDFDKATVDLSLTTDSIISGTDVENLVFRGLTLKGTRGDAICITGNNIVVENCTVKNTACSAISLTGSGNVVRGCEITHTGRGGIFIDGGDRDSLTPGESIAENNLIHNWSEIYQTYQPAILIYGVGNICRHNEIYNSPHEAISYLGNNHVIEYNLIHDVCLLTDDAGAIYSGRRWDNYGTVIRYNCIYNLGSDDHRPSGIYLDDALSGQMVYGNLLVNIPSNAIQAGGGRDLTIKNNIIINAGCPINYDQRAVDGIKGGWFDHTAPDGPMWHQIEESPWRSDIWQTAYPQTNGLVTDWTDIDNPLLFANPANSVVRDNLIFDLRKSIGEISELVLKFSIVSDNPVFGMTELGKIFANPVQGDYNIKEDCELFDLLPDFEKLPSETMGRQS